MRGAKRLTINRHLFVVLLVALVSTVFLMQNIVFVHKSTTQASSWLDTHYDNRYKLTIDNSTSSNELTNYPVKLNEGMLANYKFDENTGTTTSDSSYRAGIATLYPVTSGGTGPSWNSGGKYGYALNFDGVEDYALMNYGLIQGQRDFTISVWVKTTQAAQGAARNLDPAIMGIQQGDGDTNDFVLTNNNGKLGWYDEFGAVSNTFSSDATINDDVWHNIIVSRANTALNFYVDGTNVGSDTTGSDPVGRSDLQWTSTGYPLELGRALATGSLYFGGMIDAFRLYDHAITQTEVTSLASNNTLSRFGSLYANAQSDADDIRFTSSDGSTLLNYWIESYLPSAEDMTVWVKIPTIAANSTLDIYLYFKNAAATAVSSGIDTFVFFDDFNDGAIDTNKWTVAGSGNTETGGYYKNTAAWEDPMNALTSVGTFANNITIDYRWKQSAQYANRGQQFTYGSGATYYGIGMFEGNMYQFQRNDPYNIIRVLAKYDTNRYGVSNLTIKSTGAIACTDYSRSCVTNNDASLNNLNLMFRGWNTDMYVDWIKVRPYTSIEPSWSSNGSLELADAIPPTNPTVIVGYDTASKGSEIDSNTWHNYSSPYFEWNGASDEGSNVNGYWVYWGEDSEADPLVSGVYQTTAKFTSNITLENSKSYYLRLVTQDDFGNKAAAATLFAYKYDSLAPNSPEYVNVSPVGCSTASSFDFSWPEVIDSDSGLSGYEYRRGSGGDVIFVDDTSISVPSYQDGDNVIYVRSQDNAGNVSPWQTAVFCSTGAVHIVDGPTVQAGPSSLTTTWVSTKPTTSSVRVYEGNTYISEQGQTSYGYNHTVKVIGLEPEREYRYQIAWSDQSGNIGESDWYTTNTAQAPQINNLKVDVLSTSQVNVSWTSSIQARATIEYGTTDYEQQIVLDALNSGSSNKIENLKPGARYMLRVSATGADGTRFYSGQSFDMPPLPEASEIRYEPITDLPQSALKVTWKTNVLSSSSIFYGVKGEDKKEITKSDLKLEHEIRLEQLSDNSQYEIYVAGADSYGNQFKSSTNVVTTEYDSRPAQISAVVIESSNVGLDKQDKAQIAVSWKTDEPTSSQVEYAEGISGSEYTNLTTEDKTLTTNHLVIIPNLTPSTPYHVRISVVDRGGNVSKSEDHTVIPGDVPKSALQIILATFQRIFGWLGL